MRTLASVALLLLPLLASCGDTPTSAASSTQTRVVKLIAPGAEPRTVFAATFTAGATQRVRVTQSSSMSVFADGKTVPETGIPPLVLDLAIDVVERTADAARMRFAVQTATVADAPWADASARHMLEQELKTGTVLALGGFITVGARGTTRSTTTNSPEKASSILRNVVGQLQQTLEQCVVAWPSEPIGVGASWSVVRPLDLSGIDLRESSTWTLVRIEGTAMHLDVTLEYTTLGRAMHLPGMPADALLDLIELRGAGKGTATVEAATPFPITATIESTLDLKASAMVKDKPEPIDATIHLKSVLAKP